MFASSFGFSSLGSYSSQHCLECDGSCRWKIRYSCLLFSRLPRGLVVQPTMKRLCVFHRLSIDRDRPVPHQQKEDACQCINLTPLSVTRSSALGQIHVRTIGASVDTVESQSHRIDQSTFTLARHTKGPPQSLARECRECIGRSPSIGVGSLQWRPIHGTAFAT